MNWKRILLASLLAAVAAFFWGFISWTMLPWHNPLKFRILVSINGDGPVWIWFHGPLSNFLIMTADHLIEGLLVGLILAKFIRPAAVRTQG